MAKKEATPRAKCSREARRVSGLEGQRYGRLTVLKRTENKRGRSVWLCQCDCGNITTTVKRVLVKGLVLSCGCYNRDPSTKRIKHGESRKDRQRSSEYNAWLDMRDRCNNPRNQQYIDYGGRGIQCCERWSDFNAFKEDLGPRPEGHTLDRKDNDKGYSPDNCHWANRYVQSRNTRRNIWLEAFGRKQVCMDWSKELGVKSQTITSWLTNHPLDTLEDYINYLWQKRKIHQKPAA